MPNITYDVNPALSVDEFIRVLQDSTLAERRPVHDRARMQKMLEHSDLLITARADGRLVGLARAMTDFAYCCYLADLAVAGDFQRLGIGRRLIGLLRDHLGPQVMLLLLAAPAAQSYYPHIGFQPVTNAWMWPRES
jgi:GNAT superfamily N-acetyltransferase